MDYVFATYVFGIVFFGLFYSYVEKIWQQKSLKKSIEDFRCGIILGFAWPLILIAAIAIYFEEVSTTYSTSL
jgi:hypothetical protein